MTTGPARGHQRFDELAAGYALHALNPDDALLFASHLPACRRCQDAVDVYAEVTAALADDWPDEQPDPRLGARIVAAAVRELPPGESRQHGLAPPRGPRQGHRTARSGQPAGHRRLLTTVIATAAAAALVAAGAVTLDRLASARPGTPPALAHCVQAGTCSEVVLTSARSHARAATVIISGDTAWLRPAGLPADNPTRQVYVLWQITGTRPVAVGSFDIRAGQPRALRIGALPVPYRHTAAFAISLERGRAIPASPAPPVALGRVRG